MAYQLGVVLLLDTDTVWYSSGDKDHAMPIEQIPLFVAGNLKQLVVCSSVSMFTRPIAGNLPVILDAVTSIATPGVDVYWGCEPLDRTPYTAQQLFELARDNKVARIKLTNSLKPMAEFISAVDKYAIGSAIKLNGAMLQAVCPRYYMYARKYRDTFIPAILVVRRLGDFRRFYGGYDAPDVAIARMLDRSSKLLEYLFKSKEWDIVRRYAETFELPNQVNVRQWYQPASFAAALAVATFGRESLATRDKIVSPDINDPEGSVLRFVRVLLSDMAAKYFGPDYYYQELTNGLTKTDAKIFARRRI